MFMEAQRPVGKKSQQQGDDAVLLQWLKMKLMNQMQF